MDWLANSIKFYLHETSVSLLPPAAAHRTTAVHLNLPDSATIVIFGAVPLILIFANGTSVSIELIPLP